jgi:Ca2+-binding RTX toxin-like protein
MNEMSQFAGGANLTGFQAVLHNIMMSNEAGGGYQAYVLVQPGLAKSGYSFGPMQWDLKANPDVVQNLSARGFLDSILATNGMSAPDRLAILGIVENSIVPIGQSGGLTVAHANAINQALQTQSGLIDAQYPAALEFKLDQVDAIVATTPAAYQPFLQSDVARAFLFDYHNQFNISPVADGMDSFLHGQSVNLGGGGAPIVPVQVQGQMGLEDLLRFYLNTRYARETAAGQRDVVRRFSNVLESIGPQKITVSPEDAAYLRTLMSDPGLAPVIGRPDNWGFQQLIEKSTGIQFTRSLSDVIRGIKSQMQQATSVVSPLLLDLDGDGVETRALGLGRNFDHDGDGFAEQTGWVGGDDGLLVWDRNANGEIDDGSELFGNATQLSGGGLASNGFQALAELDSNVDGKVDAADANWSQLRIWQDFDGNAMVDGSELRDLGAAGVASIGTGYTHYGNFPDAAGNEHRQQGSFTRSGGSTGAVTDVWFAADRAFSAATDPVVVPSAIAALPDAKGFGTVYDLHQAMTRDATGDLQDLVTEFAAETDPVERAALVEQIVFRWTGAEEVDPASRGTFMDARQLHVVEQFLGEAYTGFLGANPHHASAPLLIDAYVQLREMVYGQLMAQSHLQGLYGLVTYTWDEATQILQGHLEGVQTALDAQLTADPVAGLVVVGEFGRSLRGLRLQASVEYGVLRQHLVQLGGDIAWAFDSSGRNEILGTAAAETLNGTSSPDAIRGFEGNDTLAGAQGADTLWGENGDDALHGDAGEDVVMGGAGNDTLYGDAGDDFVTGDAGNDTVYGGSGNDTIEGGSGDDQLNGEDGSDYVVGGEGTDTLSGGNGDDILEGGPGNDTMDGGGGNDTYLFGRGGGQDDIYDWDGQGPMDRILVAADVAPADVTVRRDGNDLLLRIDATGDQVRHHLWFGLGVWVGDKESIREVEFLADGTVWDVAQLKYLAFQGTAAADTLTGYETDDTSHAGGGNDTVSGGAGNDSLYGDAGDDQLSGQDGNDQLLGGEGADTLNGDNGDDTLDGGVGNDSLIGGSGSDTYLFGRGSGQDWVGNWDTGAGHVDRIQVAADVAPSEVSVRRDGNDLLLKIAATGDQMRVQWWFFSIAWEYHSLNRVEFLADGTVWDVARMESLASAIEGTEADNTLTGTGGADVIRGLGGNDTLSGAAGNDELEGGLGTDSLNGEAGNDMLRGGVGNDAYTFGPGGGQDTIVETDPTTGNSDRLQFGTGIDPLDLVLSRSVDDLILAVHGSTDRVTVKDWFAGTANEVETIQAADGQEILSTQVQQLIQDMASYSATSGLTWDQAIDQQPTEVETVLAARWQPGS